MRKLFMLCLLKSSRYFISTRQAGKISNYCGRARSGYSIGQSSSLIGQNAEADTVPAHLPEMKYRVIYKAGKINSPVLFFVLRGT